MDRLPHYLEQLIIQHDYAILPEFGGFIVNYVPAKVDESKRQISAPRKEICFNPALNYNDGLLSGLIQRTENISFRKANLLVRDSIETIRKQLKNGETVALGKIGSLRLNENGQTEFLPADSYDFLPDNIGNYNVRLGSQQTNEEETRQIVLQLPSNKRQLYKYAAAIGIILALAILTPVLHPHFSPYLARLNPLALFAADSLPSFSSLPKRYTQDDSVKATVKDSLTSDSARRSTTKTRCTAPWHVIAGSYPTKTQAVDQAHDLQKQVPGHNLAIAYSSTLHKSAVPAVSSPAAASTASWHVVVGNFETVKKAKAFVANMERAHKTKLSIYGANYVYRIVVASYSTEKEAAIKLAEIRKTADFQGAWLLRNATLLAHPVQNGQAPQPTVKVQPTTAPAKASATPQQAGATLFNSSLWYVVIANYCSQKQAQEYANSAGKKENVALSVVKDKKLYRVIAGSFDNQQAATAKARELHKHKEFAEAWAFHKLGR
jgi:hypothetical protein